MERDSAGGAAACRESRSAGARGRAPLGCAVPGRNRPRRRVRSTFGRVERYGKREDLIVHQREPFNAETGLAALAEGPVTATDAFYVRGHGAVPEIDPTAWRLRVHGLVDRPLDLSLATLREAFREREVTATREHDHTIAMETPSCTSSSPAAPDSSASN